VKRYTKNITVLYDGDAPGIKASFRGIDLILEEGLNVKVVLFPDGEDPDSFAKKSSTSELEAFIAEKQQDFISFKVDVLLETEGSDPIKKAQLIKDISHSVSLIPDQITRSVFVPEVAKRFNIKEEIIWAEVSKDRSDAAVKNQRDSLRKKIAPNKPQQTSPEADAPFDPYAHEPNPMEEEELVVDIKKDDFNEFDLMRILVKYGPLAIITKQLNEKGEEEDIETSIAELICHELHVDELVFETPLLNKMHRIISDALSENTFLKTSYFQRLEDQEIVGFVTGIEMNDYELSTKWVTKYNVHTATEEDKLQHAVMSSIYAFKVSKVEGRIDGIRKQLVAKADQMSDEDLMDLLSEQVVLEKVKQLISEKLGRIIIH
jgi:DNA primase